MRTTFIILALCIAVSGRAQDPLYSQTWHSPVYTNPALTGTAKNEWRFTGVSRLQWVRIPSTFRSFSLAAEKQVRSIKGGAALMINHSKEGYLSTNGIYGVLSKEFDNPEGNLYFNFAMQAGLVWRNVNLNDYLFADQINSNGPTGQASGVEGMPSGGNQYLDISPGFVFTWKSIMIGGAVHHLYNGDQGLFGDKDKLLQRRYTGHINFLIDMDSDDENALKLKPSVFVNVQGNSTFLKAGTLAYLPVWGVELSAWYNNNTGFAQGNSFSLGVNIKLGGGNRNPYNGEANNHSQVGINFDRELGNGLPRRTLGSFEMGGIYETNSRDNNYCPKPYGGADLKKYPWAFL